MKWEMYSQWKKYSRVRHLLPREKIHHPFFVFVVVVQSISHVRLVANPWTAALQASLSFTISQSLLKFISIESVMPSNHLVLCHPPLLLPSIFPSIRVLSNELALCIRWLKEYSFNFSIIPSNKYSGLIYFWIDWFDLLAVQGTLKNLLQHHSSKVSVLRCSTFFMIQLAYPYTTAGKTVALTIWTFVGKVMSLLFNTLSRFVINFLLRSKHLLISWLRSPSAVILELKKIVCLYFLLLYYIFPWSQGASWQSSTRWPHPSVYPTACSSSRGWIQFWD